MSVAADHGTRTAGSYPERIVCLTEEPTETLYLLGEQQRIVGISGYTVRPRQARREKPRVSAFRSGKIEEIVALRPDLVVGFSDIQADLAATLIRRGLPVVIFNQRSVAEILSTIRILGGMVGAVAKADALVERLRQGLEAARTPPADAVRRPRVYFEEWNEPLISGIRWVSELIEIAGGEDCFAELGGQSLARDRIIADPAEVVRRAPDIIIGSWCGKKFRAEELSARPGWQTIPAVRDGQVHEIKSCDILQPGPAALTDGLAQLKRIVAGWHSRVR